MRILWMLYILTGLGAFSISFLLEGRKLRVLLDAYLKKQQALFQEERDAVRFTQK